MNKLQFLKILTLRKEHNFFNLIKKKTLFIQKDAVQIYAVRPF